MMALGSSGGIGGPSSSSSSLSASAPPFTIDRFSSRPNSDPPLHYGDTPYAAPFGHTWQYRPIPSAPQSDLSMKPEVEADSTRKGSMPISSDYAYIAAGSVNPSSTQWPAINPGDTSSNSSFYVPEARPYHPSFVSPVVSEESSSLTISQPIYDPSSIHVSQVDYTEHLSGVGYTPHWQGEWKGESRHGNQIGSGGIAATENLSESSPFVYKNYINKGPSIQSGNATRGDSVNLYGLSTDGIQMASHAGSFNVRLPEGKSLFSKKHDADIYANPIDSDEKDRRSKSFNIMNLDGLSNSFNMMNVDGESLYPQNLVQIPFESSGTQFQGRTSSFPELFLPETLQGSSKCFIDNQKTYGSQESFSQPLGSFGKDPTLPMKPACTVVIKAPARSTSSSARDTDKIVGNKLISNCFSKLHDIPHLSEENGYFMSTRPESVQGSCYTNDSHTEGNYWNYIESTSKGEVATNSQFDDSIDCILSTRQPSQNTDNNVSHGFTPSFDYIQGYKHTEDPLETHILALDSPCWKGAQASFSSHNNIIESLPGIQFLKELDGCLDISGNRVGPTGVSSQDLSIGNPNFRTGFAANGELPSQTSTSEKSCAAKELNPDAAVKEVINCQNPRSPKDNSDKPRKEHHLSNNLLGNETTYSCSNQCDMENGFAPVKVNLHAGTQDGVTICNEAADAGAVAYLAAENVLYSPPSQEVCEEHNQPSVEVATQIIDTSALVNAMHSLSEVLRSSFSAKLCGLTEENQESLKRVIRNLDACVSWKIADSTPVSEYIVPQQSTFISTGYGGDLGKAKSADQPQQKVTSFGDLGHQKIHNEKINYCDYGSQARCLPYFLPSEHNKGNSSDDKMVQDIKKVLDENFNFEEEMQPQVLLFKNLWLEAEARLCSISYLAHFDNMRILMDKYNKGKGVTGDADKAPGPQDSPNSRDTSLTAFLTENGSLLEGILTKHSSCSIDTIADNVVKSWLRRFSPSFNHDDGFSPDDQHQPGIPRKTEGGIGSVVPPDVVVDVEDFGAAVLSKLNILKQRDGKSSEVQQQPSVLDTNNSGRQYGSSICEPESQINYAEAAVLARFNILKQRDDKPNEVQQQPNAHDTNNSGRQSVPVICIPDPEGQVNHAEATALARLNILRQRDSSSNADELRNVGTKKAEGQLDSSICGYGYESLKDFNQGAINDQVTQPDRNSSLASGWHDRPSSEWEHVQKDYFSWKKG